MAKGTGAVEPHVLSWDIEQGVSCSCGWVPPYGADLVATHRAHVTGFQPVSSIMDDIRLGATQRKRWEMGG